VVTTLLTILLKETFERFHQDKHAGADLGCVDPSGGDLLVKLCAAQAGCHARFGDGARQPFAEGNIYIHARHEDLPYSFAKTAANTGNS
jgi:hypothetical protein